MEGINEKKENLSRIILYVVLDPTDKKLIGETTK